MGHTFLLSRGDISWCVGLTRVPFASPGSAAIDLACGVYSGAFLDLYFDPRARRPDTLGVDLCVLNVTVRALAGTSRESEWILRPEWSTIHFEQAMREMRALLEDYGLPFLQQFSSLRDVLHFFETPERTVAADIWPSKMIALRSKGILHVLLGDVRAGVAVIDDAIAATTIEGAKEDLRSLRRRIAGD